jgi:transposase
MYVATIPNRGSPPAILLRESYREDGKVKNRTLTNLSHWPPEQIQALRSVLRGATDVAVLEEAFEVVRSQPHGHVAAVLGSLQQLKLHTLIASKRSRERDLCVAMIAGRILNPRSKLALARAVNPETSHSTLGELLDLGEVDEDEFYEAMDWLLPRQEQIESALAKRHLSEAKLVLYDVTSTYFEGRHCPLARLGYSRDGKHDKLQIVVGLLTNDEGCPVAVEVFEGNTADPKTLPAVMEKLRGRFALQELVLVGDRGMLTKARIEHDLEKTPGVSWITALRAPAIRKLAEGGLLQLSLFDEKDLAEIASPDYPGERLIVCRNPLLAEQRRRKREELLAATEAELQKVAAATIRSRRRLKGQDKIGMRVGRVLGHFKMAKHFSIEITAQGFHYSRNQPRIETEAALDGIYVIRTNLPSQRMDSEDAVRSYKRLAAIERAFRCLKTVDLKVRPINHRREERVRAHVLLCMLALYVEWHMRRALAPILFDDDDKAGAEALRRSVVAPAQRSPRAQLKARTKKTEDGFPVTSFQDLLRTLATLTKNQVQPKLANLKAFAKITPPTPLQQKAFTLLGVPPYR